jgi:hypothetical protein
MRRPLDDMTSNIVGAGKKSEVQAAANFVDIAWELGSGVTQMCKIPTGKFCQPTLDDYLTPTPLLQKDSSSKLEARMQSGCG